MMSSKKTNLFKLANVQPISGPDLANEITAFCAKNNLYINDVLRMIGRTRQSLFNWRRGTTPSLETILKFNAAKEKSI